MIYLTPNRNADAKNSMFFAKQKWPWAIVCQNVQIVWKHFSKFKQQSNPQKENDIVWKSNYANWYTELNRFDRPNTRKAVQEQSNYLITYLFSVRRGVHSFFSDRYIQTYKKLACGEHSTFSTDINATTHMSLTHMSMSFAGWDGKWFNSIMCLISWN